VVKIAFVFDSPLLSCRSLGEGGKKRSSQSFEVDVLTTDLTDKAGSLELD
jgi:hypothetical protein